MPTQTASYVWAGRHDNKHADGTKDKLHTRNKAVYHVLDPCAVRVNEDTMSVKCRMTAVSTRTIS
jgi:hypothetical protein